MTLRLPIAREGIPVILAATVLLSLLGAGAGIMFWPAAIPFAAAWIAVVWFFRDPPRHACLQPGELCAPADGRVTEICDLPDHEAFPGPAVRIGIFLSLLDVHVNRMPCSGTVRSVSYRPGRFLDARHPESGRRNESNTLVIEPEAPLPGPVVMRQVAGVLARRIVCGARPGQHFAGGARVGLIRFGSRTELILPRLPRTEITVRVGSKVRAGATLVARQPVDAVSDPRDVAKQGMVAVPGAVKAGGEREGFHDATLRTLGAGH